MKAILLNLTTPAGDELGQLPLTSVVVAAAGEPALDGNLLPRRTQFESLLSDLYVTLQANGLRSAQTPVEIEFAASLALLGAGEGDIAIPVSVHPMEPRSEGPGGNSDSAKNDGSGIRWDDLLRLTDEPKETEHA